MSYLTCICNCIHVHVSKRLGMTILCLQSRSFVVTFVWLSFLDCSNSWWNWYKLFPYIKVASSQNSSNHCYCGKWTHTGEAFASSSSVCLSLGTKHLWIVMAGSLLGWCFWFNEIYMKLRDWALVDNQENVAATQPSRFSIGLKIMRPNHNWLLSQSLLTFW